MHRSSAWRFLSTSIAFRTCLLATLATVAHPLFQQLRRLWHSIHGLLQVLRHRCARSIRNAGLDLVANSTQLLLSLLHLLLLLLLLLHLLFILHNPRPTPTAAVSYVMCSPHQLRFFLFEDTLALHCYVLLLEACNSNSNPTLSSRGGVHCGDVCRNNLRVHTLLLVQSTSVCAKPGVQIRWHQQYLKHWQKVNKWCWR